MGDVAHGGVAGCHRGVRVCCGVFSGSAKEECSLGRATGVGVVRRAGH